MEMDFDSPNKVYLLAPTLEHGPTATAADNSGGPGRLSGSLMSLQHEQGAAKLRNIDVLRMR